MRSLRVACFPALVLLLVLTGFAPLAHAQLGNYGSGLFSSVGGSKDAVGFGLWYGVSKVTLDAAQPTATNEVKGLSAATPSSFRSAGPSIGISYGSWGLNVGFNEGQANVGALADVNQTPGTTADDVYLISLRRTSRTVSVLVNPLRWLFLGYGKEEGSMEFSQVPAGGGTGVTRKLPFSNDFYSFGLACCFDPRQGGFGPIFSLYAKIPTKRGDFTASEIGAGLGVYR